MEEKFNSSNTVTTESNVEIKGDNITEKVSEVIKKTENVVSSGAGILKKVSLN